MRKVLSKIIVCCILTSIFMPGVSSLAQTDNVQPIILQGNTSQNALVLDLKDAKDIKDLPEVGALKEVEAKVKLVEKSTEATKQIRSFSMQPFAVYAITDPLEIGILWLKNNQNADGSWGREEKNEIIDTSAVLSLLNYAEKGAPSIEYQKAIDWFNLTYPENSDYLAEKVVSLAGSGQDVSSLAEFLASQINEKDHGFGYQRDYQSDVIATAKVLRAINSADYSDSGTEPVYTLKSVLTYILQSQNYDGGWSKVRGGQSDIKTTALVLGALKPYQTYVLGGVSQGDIIIQTKIDLGINYLKGYQNVNGNWQDIEETAKVYNLLLNYQEYPNYNREALNYFISNQNADGSFGDQSIYLTANALLAIAKPDVAVTDIRNISETIPNEPTVAEITITNLGYTSSQPLNFKNEPHAFHLFVDDKEVPFTYDDESPGTIVFETNSRVELNVILLNLSFGAHTIELAVDYEEVEFDKTNNQKSVELIFDDPVFTGPEPSSLVLARTTQNSNKVNVSWHLSEDSATTHYYLYLGGSSGNYTQYFDIEGMDNMVEISGFPNDVPYYFSVASVDANNTRGDYSMETSAKGYDNPNNYKGTIPFSLKDNNQNLLYGVNLNFFGVGDISNESSNPVFITAYPGHYYVTVAKIGYEEAIKTIEIKPNETGETAEFILNIIDGGGGGGTPTPPASIQNLQAQAGDGQITLTWDLFSNTSGDFNNFNIYRSSSEIINVSQLTPIDTSITGSSITQFVDNTIVNGLDYYYAVTAEDLAGNENINVVGTGPARGNSAPIISNIGAFQDGTGQVQIKYDIIDREQVDVFIEMEFWNGTAWQEGISTIGEGLQNIGTQKIMTWDPKIDYPEYDGYTKIKITVDDRQEVNTLSWLESGEFLISTLAIPKPECNQADINGDGSVDRDDLLALGAVLGRTGYCGYEDINNDANVDAMDYIELKINFGTSTGKCKQRVLSGGACI